MIRAGKIREAVAATIETATPRRNIGPGGGAKILLDQGMRTPTGSLVSRCDESSSRFAGAPPAHSARVTENTSIQLSIGGGEARSGGSFGLADFDVTGRERCSLPG
jgi:hypothetical protein